MKKLSAFALLLCLIATTAYAATTHYGYITPVVGGSQGAWGTLLNTIFGTIDSNIWSASSGTTIGVNSTSSAANITLTNPINNVQNITLSTTGKKLILPAMNATASPVVGGTFWVTNSGSNAFQITANDGSTNVVTALTAGQSVAIQPLTNSTANGTFDVYGPYLTTVGTVVLGTSAAAPNPTSSFGATSGFFSATATSDGVAVGGTQVASFTSTGINSTAIGATTSSTGAFTTLATPSATIAGGTINGTSLGATTSSTAKVTTLSATAFTASSMTVGGIAFPITNGTNTQFLQTNGSGTSTWASPPSVITGGSVGTTVPQSATSFIWFGESATESNVYSFLPSGTLSKFIVKASSGLPSGQTAQFTVRKDGVNTAITCTITGTSDNCNDGTHTVASTTNAFSVQVVTSATTGALNYSFSMLETIP